MQFALKIMMYIVKLSFDPLTFDEYSSSNFPSLEGGALVLFATSKDKTKALEHQYDIIGLKFFKFFEEFQMAYEELKPNIVLFARRSFIIAEDGFKLENQVKSYLDSIFSTIKPKWNCFDNF